MNPIHSDQHENVYHIACWLILFVNTFPLAILALILFPAIWLLTLPFRLIGMLVCASLALVKTILFLPARLLVTKDDHTKRREISGPGFLKFLGQALYMRAVFCDHARRQALPVVPMQIQISRHQAEAKRVRPPQRR